MIIIADKRIPEIAKTKLSSYGEVIEFETKGIVYDAISGHPDIFFCQTPDMLFVAKNCPEKYVKLLDVNKIKYKFGSSNLGNIHPKTSHYNAVFAGKYLIHNLKITDNEIIKYAVNQSGIQQVNVKQSYTRCNLISVKDVFLTSDIGIFNKLKSMGERIFYVESEAIFLYGFNNGFFGGCCGVIYDKLFVLGSLSNIKGSDNLTDILSRKGVDIIELFDGRLFDGGGIFFIDS